MLLNHVAGSSTSGDEARLHHRLERYQNLLNRQVNGELGISVLFGERARHIEDDINLVALFRDIFEISIDSGIIERIHHIRLCYAAGLVDLTRYTLKIRFGPTNKKHLRAFRGKFFRDGSANRTACAEHDRALSL